MIVFFDEDYLYILQPDASARFPLKNITEIVKTGISLGKKPTWQIIVTDENGQKMRFRFRPKVYLFNTKDWSNFLEASRKANPAVTITKWKWPNLFG